MPGKVSPLTLHNWLAGLKLSDSPVPGARIYHMNTGNNRPGNCKPMAIS
jgi:hypothetical protein